ncbi:MAG TPA: hypothetical protein VGC65_00140 [Bacteroidia bacterium]|jgi:hypothetical protein
MNKRDFIFIVIIAVLLFLTWKGCKKGDSFEAMYNASADTLHQVRNKLGQEETSTALLYGSVSVLKKVRAADSSAIGKLQKLVDRLTISATYLSNVTENSISSGTDAVIIHDTVKGADGISYVYPEYRDTIRNKWENFVIAATKDSFHLDYKVFNEFNLTQSWERQGFLKRKKPITTITNLNPHTETKEIATFTIKEDKSNRLRDGLIGATVGALLVTGLQVFNVKIPINLKFK